MSGGGAAAGPAAGVPVAGSAGLSRRHPRRGRAAVALFVAAAVLLAAALLSRSPASPAGEPAGGAAARLHAAPEAAFAIGPPVGLDRHARETTWAAVRHDVTARRRAAGSAPGVGLLTTRTPEATTNIVVVLGRRRDPGGRLWIRVRLPALPNGTIGWVPRAALGAYGTVRTRLVVDLARRRATLLRDGRAVLRFAVGVGMPGAPTPRGEFVVRNRLARYKSAFYGPVAFGTSARSATLTDWPGGGYVGIHGTDRPDLIPGAVSHGCIRLRNSDIVRLARALPVGTPLTIG